MYKGKSHWYQDEAGKFVVCHLPMQTLCVLDLESEADDMIALLSQTTQIAEYIVEPQTVNNKQTFALHSKFQSRTPSFTIDDEAQANQTLQVLNDLYKSILHTDH